MSTSRKRRYPRTNKSPKEVVFISSSGDLFLMRKEKSKWYLLGQSLDNTHQWPIMFSTNKKKLTKFVKTLGFEPL